MDDPNIHAYGEGGPDDAEIGRQWRENSSLEKWFPLTAEELERLRADNAALRREAHSWWTAARDALKLREPLAPEAIPAALCPRAGAAAWDWGLTQRMNAMETEHPRDDQKRACLRCLWWRPTNSVAGHCKRMPPALPDGEAEGFWPMTGRGDWCGEYTQAEAP